MAKFEIRGNFFVLYFLISLSVEGAVITESPPQLVTVSPFGTATFKYEGIGNELNLLVQGAPLTPEVQQQRRIKYTGPGGPGNLSSELSIVGLPINDGIGISCFVQSYPPLEQAFSLGTTLRLKGVSPVQDLIHNFPKNNLLLITWSPPVYYSNDVLPDLFYYQVLVTDEEDGDIILDTNTTNTNINITVYNVTQCDTFNISVIALFAEYISISETISNNGSYSITGYDTQPLIPSISFKLGCPPSKSLVSLMDGSTEVTDIINETEHIIGFKLSPFRHYELTAVVKNLRGKTKATYDTLISTFHTQDIIISSPYTNGSVSVQCVLVLGSTADGCHMIFTDTDQQLFLNVSLNQGPTLVTLPAGNYIVTAYDIINGSIYGPAVYYTILVEIIKVKPSTYTFSIIIINTNTDTGGSQTVPFYSSSLTTSDIHVAMTPSTYSNDHTMSSQDSNTMPLLYIIIIVVGAMLLTIIMIVIVTFVALQSLRKKANEVTEERITNNPAYAQVTPSSEFPHYVNSQISRVLTNNNPAYETVLFNANNINDLVVYETVH